LSLRFIFLKVLLVPHLLIDELYLQPNRLKC
jgi:hypothetical protein